MNVFKNLKIGSKLSIGVGIVVFILIFTVLFGFFGLKKMSDSFTYYQQISSTHALAGRVQANLLESRIAFKNYVKTGEQVQREIFEEHFDKMETFIHELEANIENPDYLTRIQIIHERMDEYKKSFDQVVVYKTKREEIYQNILTIKGPEMENNLAQLVDDTYESNNNRLHYGATYAMKSLLKARMSSAVYLENNDLQQIQIAKETFDQMEDWLRSCLDSTGNERYIQIINRLLEDQETYMEGLEAIVSVIENRDQVIQRMDEIGPQISTISDEIKLDLINEQAALEPVVNQSRNQALMQMVFLTILASLCAVFISVFFIRIVVTPVATVTNTFKEISEGEADLKVRLKVDSTDELGDMAKYFNQFIEKLQVIMTFNQNLSWLKAGQADLNEKIRNEQHVESLTESIITYVSKYLNAQIGAIYLKSEDNTFRLQGSYAYKHRKGLPDKISVSEGLIGQAVLEKKIIIVSNLPDDYIKISSGVGEAIPRNILILPCVANNEVQCVIELGAFQEFSDIQIEYMEQVGEGIAISIHAAEARQKMQELLAKTMEQSEELQVQQEELKQSNEELEEQAKALRQSEAALQAQQEELRQSNEELEEQARALRESEARLQSQQEELRVTNDELVERTKNLEHQKKEIEHKNDVLLKAQQEIEEKALALENASKYKSEFLANMSHELRTPLNSIIVLSQMLKEKKAESPLTDKQVEYAKTIHSSGEDLLKLINDILDLSKVEAGKLDILLEEVELDELIQGIAKSFNPIAQQKGLEFVIDIENEGPVRIVSDRQRLTQIINNLLSNAFKFTQEGSVAIKIAHTANQEIAIAIQDTGIGIPADKHEVIFEAFRQTDGTTSRKYGGTGLGLSISKELVSLLGGRIELKSELGKGSTFRIVLPVSEEKQQEPQQAAAVLEKEEPIQTDRGVQIKSDAAEFFEKEMHIRSDAQDKLLLIIEDDGKFSQILADLAQEKGYRCITAENGELGLKLAQQYKPDAVLLDIGLPDINGWKVIERLKTDSLTEKIPVHVISGTEMNSPDGAANGIVGYLKKPVSIETLNHTFQKMENAISKPLRKLMIIDGNQEQTKEIAKLIGDIGIQVISMEKGEDALNLLRQEPVDCLIVDLELQDMTGFEFLQRLRDENIRDVSVIIHTERALTQDDETELSKYTQSIVMKGSHSVDRLVAEARLFLHDVNTKIDKGNIRAIKSEQEKEKLLKEKKILVVDDDMRNVFALTSILEEKGMNVIIGRNGNEAIQNLEKNPDVNLILMDIMMPEMDGYTAMAKIREMEKFKRIPIIALTAKAMKDDRQKCIAAGANDYLTKPLDMDKLTSLLRVWLYQ